MKLYNIKTDPYTLMAEISERYEVKFIHPMIKKAIDAQHGAIIPQIKKFADEFDGRTKIPRDDPNFGKALYYQLKYDYASHPETYKWLNGEQLGKIYSDNRETS